jgi:hypothetical protein
MRTHEEHIALREVVTLLNLALTLRADRMYKTWMTTTIDDIYLIAVYVQILDKVVLDILADGNDAVAAA